jgi:hypothetical protein
LAVLLSACGSSSSTESDTDTDGDGFVDSQDAFPQDPRESKDTDLDTIGDNTDNCPAIANADQTNTDANFENGDGQGDLCDSDDDADGVDDSADAFPLDASESMDTDGDTIGDNADNCPVITNTDQLNSDGDSAGDACDALPDDATETLNNDGDAFGDNADPDDDNDSTLDVDDAFPFDATEQKDIDQDGVGDNKDLDLTEVTGSNPNSIQMARLLETDRATKIKNLDGGKFRGVMTSVGDVNHDGYDDLAIADQYFNSSSGYVFIIFGQQGGWPNTLDLNSLQSITDSGVKYIEIQAIENYLPEEGLENVYLGMDIAALGDVNADDIDDFVISKKFDGNDKDESLEYKNNYPGEIMIILGREAENWTDSTITIDELKANYAYSVYASEFNGELGRSVINAGDINGDNINDIIIAESNWKTEGGPTQQSRIHVIFGSNQISLGRNHIEAIPLLSTVAQDYSGLSRIEIYGNEVDNYLMHLTAIGDMNADGFADFAMSSERSDNAFIIWGKADWADRLDPNAITPSDGFKVLGLIPSSYAVHARSSGDLNGDGITDLVIASSNGTTSTGNKGLVYILWGGRGSWPIELNVTSLDDFFGISISDVTPQGSMGAGVAVLPDTNADGIDELLISKEYDFGLDESELDGVVHNPNGNIFKVMGRSDWQAENPITSVINEWFQGIYADKPLGAQVDVSGDFNGDGFLDMIFVNQFVLGPTPDSYTSESYVVYGYNQLYPSAE